uniref:Putative transcription factor grauzone-like protein n=1 Tax=Lutzomyia longipalpis TaxID=7200 RepID=A0A1B0CLJ7_LUTLO
MKKVTQEPMKASILMNQIVQIQKKKIAEHPEEDVEERTKSTKDRKSRDEKIDEEIHAFFKMECVLCNIPFSRFTDVQVHFRKEHKRRGYVVCCGKKLNRPMKLHEHMNVHVNPTKHQCPVCEKWYKTHDSMLMHRKLQHTPVEERKFFCKKCPKRFALAHALTAHMITHMPAEEKKHVCSTCGQAFALATILVQHVRRVHENAHVQVCEICAKVFRCKNIFEKHMLEHNNQLKPTIPCTVCGKMFTYLVAMQRHRRRHNTSGSLECPICQRVAANRQALQEHIKNNHRERKASSVASVGFNSNANYFHHKKNAHPAEHKAEREKRLAQQVFLKPEVKAD